MDLKWLALILLFVTLCLFVWNRWRYDIVALFALLAACFIGLVPVDKAFLGFGHPAVILVAAALIISHGLNSSGSIGVILRVISLDGKALWLQLLVICSITALLSGFINNVGAVAVMLPFVTSLAYKSKKPISLYLMPLAFSSLLGGLMTLIGTPPNIVISIFRDGELGSGAFRMFDFFPVGAVMTFIGVLFVSFVGWRFLPKYEVEEDLEELFGISNFLTEVKVNEDCRCIGMNLGEFSEKYSDLQILGFIREGNKNLRPSPYTLLKANDLLVIEAAGEDVEEILAHEGLSIAALGSDQSVLDDEEIVLMEALVQPNSPAVGRSIRQLDLARHYDFKLVAVARSGRRLKQRLPDVKIHAGDVLLVQGSKEELKGVFERYSWVSLAKRDWELSPKPQVVVPPVVFAACLVAAYVGLIDITLALVLCAFLYALFGFVKLQDLYRAVQWPVIVLLACLIPVGEAVDDVGSLQMIAGFMLNTLEGQSAVLVLVTVMAMTMVLTNIINNAAAAVIMAPLALSIAKAIDVSSDSFLMAVAVSASCAFVTPISHQSNALVMEPGGYSFADFSKLGVPMSILSLAMGVPLILYFWPL